MKKTYKTLCLFLCGVVSLSLFAGCGKENGPTTSELMSQYASDYTAPENLPSIWLYGDDNTYFKDRIGNYNFNCTKNNKVNKTVKVQSFRSLSEEQFAVKMQAEIMAGKGPDLVLSASTNILSDVNKSVRSGAFQGWDELIADWNEDDYFKQIAYGGYSPDGKTYILPLTVEPIFVLTTKENMKKFGFTEEDFSDFYKTTDTLLRIWEQIGDDTAVAANASTPELSMMIPSLYDYSKQKTSLTEPKTQELLEKWKQIVALQAQRTDPMEEINRALWEKDHPNKPYLMNYYLYQFDTEYAQQSKGEEYLGRVLAFATYEQLTDAFFVSNILSDAYTEKDRSQRIQKNEDNFVFFPLYDTEGKLAGKIHTYALLTEKCKNIETVKSFITSFVMLTNLDGSINEGTHIQVEDTGIALSKYATINKVVDDPSMKDAAKRLIPMLDAAEMSLTMWNDTLEGYQTRLMENLTSDNPDWRDLETDINIYLSE